MMHPLDLDIIAEVGRLKAENHRLKRENEILRQSLDDVVADCNRILKDIKK